MLKRVRELVLVCLAGMMVSAVVIAAELPQTQKSEPAAGREIQGRTEEEQKLREAREEQERIKRQAAEQEREKARALTEAEIVSRLPEDTTPRLTVRQINISGNTLISTEKLLEKTPRIYNASNVPIDEAAGNYLYDFRVLSEVISNPGEAREISTRTVQGFTQYLTSVYTKHNYAGIYVRVQPEAIVDGQLKEQVLPIEVIEIAVSAVKSTFFDIERNETEKSYLRQDIFEQWSPVKQGEVINKKKLDDFINLLNLNPDRFISTTVSQGAEPRTLNVAYDIYEINPWHYFIQIDNAGTDDRQWTPRVGVINTNLTGRDDRLTAVAQGPVHEDPTENYSVYGSYDVPLWTPKLRLKVFGGKSEFDVDGGGGIDFLGKGYFYGGELRLNVFQRDQWFFDLLTSLSYEKSKFKPSEFPEFFASDVAMDLWGTGFDLHRRNDKSDTSFVFNRLENVGGSSQRRFWDAATLTGARTNADRNFTVLTFTANHSEFLDTTKIHRILGSFRYIRPNDRLVPSRMTTFGGMYTVRGYKESRIVADGGILASLQYEYDLVKKGQAEQAQNGEADKAETEPWLKKLAPLAFLDFGRAVTEDPVPSEQGTEELVSLGTGVIVEVGEHFNAAIYYGVPLRSADDTDKGNGRFNIGLMARW